MIIEDLTGKEFKIDKCLGCEIASENLHVFGGLLYQSANFAIAQDFELPINGFLIIFSKRHVEKLNDLSPDEQSELMDLISKTLKILQENNVAEEYNVILEEKKGYHLHVWLMPRHKWMIEKFGKVLKNISAIQEYAIKNMKTQKNYDQIEKTCNIVKNGLKTYRTEKIGGCNMLYTKSGKEVSKIGIGTWTISKDNIDSEVAALKFCVMGGVNYIDVVLAYDNGRTLDVIAKFLKQVKREDIYVNALITHGCSKIENIEQQINTYLQKLDLDYLDCVTLHSVEVIGFPFEEYVKEIKRLKKSKKFLAIGYSNLSPEQLKLVAKEADFFEGLYNLECKVNEDTGLIKSCQEHGIPFYAYQPLRRNRTAKQNYKEVVDLANKYGKTQNQILINWLVKHKNIGVLIKSSNKDHIKENLSALSFDMTENDYKILDSFRNKDFDKIDISYVTEPNKVRIDQLPNQPIGRC